MGKSSPKDTAATTLPMTLSQNRKAAEYVGSRGSATSGANKTVAWGNQMPSTRGAST